MCGLESLLYALLFDTQNQCISQYTPVRGPLCSRPRYYSFRSGNLRGELHVKDKEWDGFQAVSRS